MCLLLKSDENKLKKFHFEFAQQAHVEGTFFLELH